MMIKRDKRLGQTFIRCLGKSLSLCCGYLIIANTSKHDEYVADKQLNSSILSCALCYSIFLPKVNNNGLGHKNTRT